MTDDTHDVAKSELKLQEALEENRRRSEVLARSAMRLQGARPRDEAPAESVGRTEGDPSEEVAEPDG